MNTVSTITVQPAIEVVESTRKRPPAFAENVIDFFERKGWEYKVLGRAEMPEQVTHLGRWTVVPADIDATHIPDHAMGKVTSIFAQGYRPKGFLLIHETNGSAVDAENYPISTMTTPRPGWFEETRQVKPKASRPPDYSKIIKSLRPAADVIGGLLKVLAVVATLVIAAVVVVNIIKMLVVFGGIILVGLAILLGATGVDPVLVVVTDDNYWIEIDRWIEA